MTEALKRPPKKDPQKRTDSPTLPPYARSRKAIAFTSAAAEGRFALQVCDDCGHVTYPLPGPRGLPEVLVDGDSLEGCR